MACMRRDTNLLDGNFLLIPVGGGRYYATVGDKRLTVVKNADGTFTATVADTGQTFSHKKRNAAANAAVRAILTA